jgi:hypothetical protein
MRLLAVVLASFGFAPRRAARIVVAGTGPAFHLVGAHRGTADSCILDPARRVTIPGNTFWEGFERDLLVGNSNEIAVGNLVGNK